MRVAVLGAGQMGTAFGKPVLDNGNELVYWGPEWIDTPALEALAAGKPHPDLGVALPATVDTTLSIEEAVRDADLVALAVTGEGAEWVAPEAAKYTPEGAPVMVFSKGLIGGDGGEIVAVPEFTQKVFGPSRKVVGVGGPVKAIDLIEGSPTQTAFAAASLDDARAACERFAADYYFPGASDDLSGLGFCAALKNCYAIAFGMITGDEAKPNLRALAFGTALGEISRLVSAAGGRPETVTGAAGAGDLYVTCLSGRNGDFGRRLNTGAGREEALEDMNNATVEGLGTLPPALNLARSLDLGEEELPLLYKLDAVLRKEESARDLHLADLLL
ncbi:2-dehydropantoate 2-reductase N-terminal domain-containing protein [soil metagenome]